MAKPKPIEGVEGEFEQIKSDDGGLGAYKQKTDKRFADIEQLTKAILFVAIIALIGVIVAVSGLVLDQMHFNNQTYRQQASDNQAQLRLLQDDINRLKGAQDEQKTIQKN